MYAIRHLTGVIELTDTCPDCNVAELISLSPDFVVQDGKAFDIINSKVVFFSASAPNDAAVG